MKDRNEVRGPGQVPSAKPDQLETKEAVQKTRTTAASDSVPPTKCECPPGCVHLPCCT